MTKKTPVTVVADTPKDSSPREELARWIREEIEGASSVSLPVLTDSAVAHFSGDPSFVNRFLHEALRPMVYDIAQRVMRQTRPTEGIVVLGDEIVTKEEAKARADRLSSRWSRWLEHVGTKHIQLTSMTKSDLLFAANERRRRGDTEYELAALWEALAERLEGNERVGERFNAHEIERVRVSLIELRKAA